MTMRMKLLYLLPALFTLSAIAQIPNLAWVNKAFINNYNSYNYDALLGSDGYFYSCGTGNTGPSIVDSDLYLAKHDSGGNLVWLRQFPGEGAALTYGRNLVTDAQGNFYLSGTFNRTVDFNPGSGVFNLTSIPQNGNYYNHDVFILKLDPNGNFLWAKKFGNGYSEKCTSMEIDSQGNLILLGTYESTMDIDPGTGVHNLTSVSIEDIYVLKLDGDGNFLWAKSGGSLYTENTGKIAIDSSDNIYFTGRHDGGFSWYEQAGFESPDPAMMVVKMDASGTVQWMNGINGYVTPDAINIDSNGNIVFGGIFKGANFDFDMGDGTFLMSTQNSQLESGFLERIDADGNFVWAKLLTIDTQVRQIKFDAANDFYICGYHDGGSTFTGPQTASVEGFVAKLAPDGDFIWAISNPQVTIPNTNNYSLTQYTGIAIAANGQIYATGNYDGFNDFDPGSSVYQFPAPGDYSDGIFIEKLNQGTLGLPDVEQQSVAVYPNPSNGIFTVSLGTNSDAIPVTIYNPLGQLVFGKTFSAADRTIDLSTYPDGMYLMQLDLNGKRSTQKLIKR